MFSETRLQALEFNDAQLLKDVKINENYDWESCAGYKVVRVRNKINSPLSLCRADYFPLLI